MLSSLPTEILLYVVDFLDPESCLHLALTCRSYHKLSMTVLQRHGRLLAEHQVIDTADTGDVGCQTDPYIIWKTLEEVLDDPSKGWYIRELNLPASRNLYFDPSGPALSKVDKTIFQDAARDLGRMYPPLSGLDSDENEERNPSHNWTDLIAEFDDNIASGSDDAIIAILIHHLPNLTTIRMTDDHLECVQLMLRWIAKSYDTSTQVHQLPLRHLKNASIAHWDSEGSCDADWAFLLCSLPSVRNFAAATMGGARGPFDTQIFQTGRGSQLTELWLDRCVIDLDSLIVLLSGTKGLRKLHYTDGGSIVSYDRFEPKKIIQVIGECVGTSLQRLTLAQDLFFRDNENDLPRVSMRNFQSLRQLDCQWDMLLLARAEESDVDEALESGFHRESDKSDDEVSLSESDIRDVLPASLEELRIEGYFSPEAWNIMRENFNEDNAATPKLQKIWVGCRSRADHGVRTDAVFGERPDFQDEGNEISALLDDHGYV